MSKRTLIPLTLATAVASLAGLFLVASAWAWLPVAEASPTTLALAQQSPSHRASPAQTDLPRPVSASPASGAAQLPPVVGGVFHPDRATPYFEHPVAAPLRKRLLAADWPGALVAADQALAQQAPHPERVLFVTAWLLGQQERHAEAAPLFERLSGTYAVLGGLSAHLAARSYYHLGLHERALVLAARVAKGDSAAPRNLLLVGDVHRARAMWPEAARAYETFLRDRAGRHGTDEARLRLAECLGAARSPDADARRRVVELLRQVILESPGTVWGKRAEALLPAALAAVPDPRLRARLASPSCADELLRTEALLKRGRLGQAAASLGTASRLGGCPRPRLCQAATVLGRRQSRRKVLRTVARTTLALARRTCVGPALADAWVKSTYSLARTEAALGRTAPAKALFLSIEARYPGHSYADDARYQLASLLAKQGRAREADRLLRALPRRYPRGDMSHAALWRLAFGAYGRGALGDALALFTQAEALRGEPDREEDAGRASYWRSRVLARLGRTGEAMDGLAALARKRPLGYYALLALNRLQERQPETARAILISWRQAAPPAAWTFGPSPIFARPGFARAVELARLGLGELAAAELGHVGIRSPVRTPGEPNASGGALPLEAKERALGKAEEEALWAAAVLYDRAGLPQKSHWIVRHALREHESRPPTGLDRARWRVGFPEAYAPLVAEHAKANQLPRALVFGLMREESAFNPGLVSHAGAVGLMQLLEETARRFRAGPKGPITKATLKEPPRNVPIGAKYLGWLLRLFHGQLVLAVASYNAGETKVFSWMQERGNQPVDRFVEEIPFRETRHYVKRVLGSAFAYAVLEGGPDPLLGVPEVFPPDLVVKSRSWQKLARSWAKARAAAAVKPSKARRSPKTGRLGSARKGVRTGRPPKAGQAGKRGQAGQVGKASQAGKPDQAGKVTRATRRAPRGSLAPRPDPSSSRLRPTEPPPAPRP